MPSFIPAIQLRSASTRYQASWNLGSSRSRWIPFQGLPADRNIPDDNLVVAPSAADARTSRIARLEAVLFLARESLNSRKLSDYADLNDGTEARTLIHQLNQLYQQEQSVLRVERVAGGYQLVTHWQFGRWLKRLGVDQPGERLSLPSLETLSVVAYRQPVLRVEIEAIRGVSCGEMLRQLMDRDLVRIQGRSEELGRPYLYGTTKRFLQQFGLDNIEELLEMDTFAPPVQVNEESQSDAHSPDGDDELMSTEEWPASEGEDDEEKELGDYEDDESDDDYLEEEDQEEEEEQEEDQEEEEWDTEDDWEEVADDDEDDEDNEDAADDVEEDEAWQDGDDWEEEKEGDDDEEDDDDEDDEEDDDDDADDEDD